MEAYSCRISCINDPKVRLILLIVFWVAMLVTAIVIIGTVGESPKFLYPPDLKWYDKEATYEIFPQSFKDSSPKAEGAAKEGDGVGDINGTFHHGHWKLKKNIVVCILKTRGSLF